MAFATNPLLHARMPKRRALASARIALKVAIGLAAVVITVTAMTAAVVGVGRLLAVPFAARSDFRSTLALVPPANGPGWSPRPTVSAATQLALVATLLPPAARTPSPVANPTGSISLTPDVSDTQEDPSADQEYTGSIGAGPDSAFAGSEGPSRDPLTGDAAHPLPLPPAQTRLAALPPADDVGGRPLDDPSARTAIYDITAQTVYLPNGERLKAHSGLGGLMDDPRYVRRKNRGATPPNTYRLTLRERPFHGVQAIRLTPVNDEAMFGRDGILAHSYMLGPSGQSNGCVSFKDYPKFLRAFLRGEIDRMVVVSRLSRRPRFFAHRNQQSDS